MKVREFGSILELQKFLDSSPDIEIVSITPIYCTTTFAEDNVPHLRGKICYVLQFQDVKSVNDKNIGKFFDMIWTGSKDIMIDAGVTYEDARDEFNFLFKKWYQNVILQQYPDENA